MSFRKCRCVWVWVFFGGLDEGNMVYIENVTATGRWITTFRHKHKWFIKSFLKMRKTCWTLFSVSVARNSQSVYYFKSIHNVAMGLTLNTDNIIRREWSKDWRKKHAHKPLTMLPAKCSEPENIWIFVCSCCLFWFKLLSLKNSSIHFYCENYFISIQSTMVTL